MKFNFKLIVLFTSVVFLNGCSSSNAEIAPIVINQSDIVTKTIGVQGMTCVGCEVTLESEISKIKGVVSVKASSTDDKAIIEFDSTKTSRSEIVKTIKNSGYDPF